MTKRNLAFLRVVLRRGAGAALKPDTALRPGDELHEQLIALLVEKGGSILRRFQLHTPANGQIYEQFDKVTGRPVSSPGIGWGHAAFLSAALARDGAVPLGRPRPR